MPVGEPQEDVQQAAAYIGQEVGERSGIENHICGLSPSRQSSGSKRLSRESVENERSALDRKNPEGH